MATQTTISTPAEADHRRGARVPCPLPLEVRRVDLDPDGTGAGEALRAALAGKLGRDPAEIELRRGAAGKPGLAGGDAGRLELNVSRGGGLCLMAFSEAGPVGVDVEELRDLPDLERLVRARLGPGEAAAVLGAEGRERLRAFYRQWTRKEACAKALGEGVDAALEFTSPDGVLPPRRRGRGPALVDLDLGDGHVGAVALALPVPSHGGRDGVDADRG